MSNRGDQKINKGRMIFLRDGQSFSSDMKVEMVRIVDNIHSDSEDSPSEKAIVINFQETCNVIMIKVKTGENISDVCEEVSTDIDRGYGVKLVNAIDDIIQERVDAAVKAAIDALIPKGIIKSGLPMPGDIAKKVGFT